MSQNETTGIPDLRRRLVLKTMAAMAAVAGSWPLSAAARVSESADPRRWRLLSFGGCGRRIVERFWKEHPDLVSSRVAVISGMDNLPPDLATKDGRSGAMGRFLPASFSTEALPTLIVAGLGGFAGGEYSREYLHRFREAADSGLSIHGVMIRPFNFEGRRFERSYLQERELSGLLDTLCVVDNNPRHGDASVLDAMDSAERLTVSKIAGYLAI
jgi:hypothetical protein